MSANSPHPPLLEKGLIGVDEERLRPTLCWIGELILAGREVSSFIEKPKVRREGIKCIN